MVRFTVLASGSKGNSCIVSSFPSGPEAKSASTRILVDAGLSCRELFRRMHLAGEDPSTLDAILITHEHIDHVNGLAVTARKLGIPVYFTEATHRAWLRMTTPRHRLTYAQWAEQYRQQHDSQGNQESSAPVSAGQSEVLKGHGFSRAIRTETKSGALAPEGSSSAESHAPPPLPSVQYFRAGHPFTIGDVSISPFTIPHDAADPVGFVFTAEGVRLAVATDLGYMPPNVQAQLRRCDLIMLESNHDLEMLRDGPYPWSVKQRVLSRVGHLSNDATAHFLEATYDGNATCLILAHLSESNNLPELARLAAERALSSHPSLLANRLLLASQHEPLASVCF